MRSFLLFARDVKGDYFFACDSDDYSGLCEFGVVCQEAGTYSSFSVVPYFEIVKFYLDTINKEAKN